MNALNYQLNLLSKNYKAQIDPNFEKHSPFLSQSQIKTEKNYTLGNQGLEAIDIFPSPANFLSRRRNDTE